MISPVEIQDVFNQDPTRALLMMIFNSILEDADLQASGKKVYVPRFHEDGWRIAVETPQGFIGLWSSWLGNQFYLGYPKSFDNSSAIDMMIVNFLGVECAKPVLQVNATAVSEGYEGECKDIDKPLETNAVGQTIAYKIIGPRLWAKFYGPRVKDKLGRFWVDHSDFNPNAYYFDVIKDSGLRVIETVRMGHEHSMSVASFPFNFVNKYAPDGPTVNKQVVQSYRTPFLLLVCEIAKLMGGANAVHIDYGFTIVPEQLAYLGYDNIRSLDGEPDSHSGGEATFYAEKGGETLVLKMGDGMAPWNTIRRVTLKSELTVDDLINLLTF